MGEQRGVPHCSQEAQAKARAAWHQQFQRKDPPSKEKEKEKRRIKEEQPFEEEMLPLDEEEQKIKRRKREEQREEIEDFAAWCKQEEEERACSLEDARLKALLARLSPVKDEQVAKEEVEIKLEDMLD